MNQPAYPTVGAKVLAEWQAAREAVKAMERAEHPDIVDEYGRVWEWFGKDLYTHCDRVAPVEWIPRIPKQLGQQALDSQNYYPCDICLDGRTRNVTPCKPEWNCGHRTCAEMRDAEETS